LQEDLRCDHKTFILARRRQKEQTAEFKNTYRYHSGIEATMSFLDRKTGLKQLRVRGIQAIGFCVNLKAAGFNFLRVAAFKFNKKGSPAPKKPGPSQMNSPFFVFKELIMTFFCPAVLDRTQDQRNFALRAA
jgi:hypothetical protein